MTDWLSIWYTFTYLSTSFLVKKNPCPSPLSFFFLFLLSVPPSPFLFSLFSLSSLTLVFFVHRSFSHAFLSPSVSTFLHIHLAFQLSVHPFTHPLTSNQQLDSIRFDSLFNSLVFTPSFFFLLFPVPSYFLTLFTFTYIYITQKYIYPKRLSVPTPALHFLSCF